MGQLTLVASSDVPDSQKSGFPRANRLLKAREYDAVFKKNRRVVNRYWTVLGHQQQEDQPRLGMAIAKKRAKHAVTRNRIKRVCRESFRHHRQLLSGFDVVVMNRDAAATATKQELRLALDDLWKKLQRSDS